MSDQQKLRASIANKFDELEQGYGDPRVSAKDFQGRINSLRDAIKQLNSPEDTGLRLVKVGVGRKHELKVIPT